MLQAIISASLSSAIENTLAIGTGFLLVRLDFLSDKLLIQKSSSMLLFFFLPCLICYSFSTKTNIQSFIEYWGIMLYSVIMQGVQFVLGNVFFSRVVRSEELSELVRKTSILAVTFTSYTFLPIVYAQSLINNSTIFDLIDGAYEKVIVFVALYAVPQRMFFYSFGFYYIDKMSVESSEDGKVVKRSQGIWGFIKKLMTPPILAIFVGITIGSIPFLRDYLFINPPTLLKGIPSVMQKFGLITIGLANLIAGANLGRTFLKVKDLTPEEQRAEEERKKQERKDIRNGIKKRKEFSFKEHFSIRKIKTNIRQTIDLFKFTNIPYFQVFKSVVIKLIVNPFIGICLIYIFSFAGPILIRDEKVRALAWILCILESSVPLLLALHIIVSISAQKAVGALSEIMISQYVLAPFTMSIFLFISIYFVCSFELCNL